MTDAVYFLQSFLSLNSFSSIGTSRGEIRLANALNKDARRLVTEAEEEDRNAQAFVEIDDQRLMTKKFDENNTKSDKLFTEADELEAKAKRLEKENKDLFVSLSK